MLKEAEQKNIYQNYYVGLVGKEALPFDDGKIRSYTGPRTYHGIGVDLPINLKCQNAEILFMMEK